MKAIRKFFNVMVHNYDISFWNEDLCHKISYDTDIDLLPDDDYDFDELDEDNGEFDELEIEGGNEPDDREPTWSVEIKYKNGTEQNIKDYDFIPDPVIELFTDFEDYFFEEDLSENDFDENDVESEDNDSEVAENEKF